MRIQLDAPETPANPIIVIEPVSVSLRIVSDDGISTAEPHRVDVEIRTLRSTRTLAPVAHDGDTVRYCVSLEPWSGFLLPRLVVRATPLDGGTPLVKEVTLVSADLSWLRRACLLGLALAALYILLAAPQLESVLKLLEADAGLPIAGSAAVLLAWARPRVSMLLRFPLAALGSVVVAWLAIAGLRANQFVVINRSLSTLTLPDGTQLEPGKFAIGPAPVAANGTCVSNPTAATEKPAPGLKRCITFDDQPELGWTRLLLLKRREYGCLDIGVRAKLWQKAAQGCQPESGVELKAEPATEVFLSESKDLNEVKASALVPWDSKTGSLARPQTDDYVSMVFMVVGSEQVSPHDLRLAGRGVVTSMEMPLTPGKRLISTLRKKAESTIEAELLRGGLIVGSLTASLQAPVADAARCWLLPTGERLGVLMLRSAQGENMSLFRAVAPELVSSTPACWNAARGPEFAELHLDARWVPSKTWALTLPKELVPRRISVLDGKGIFWGEVSCVDPDRNHPSWTLAPFSISNPRREVAQLRGRGKANYWKAAPSHEVDEWAWGCWPTNQQPEQWSGNGLWSLSLDSATGKYTADRGKPACHYRLDRSPGPPRCEPGRSVSDEDKKRWFTAQAPHCDERSSTLCT